MKKVLLHTCCGVCSLYCILRLKEEGYLVESYFYNPNIYPLEEYQKRRDVAKEVSRITQTRLTEADYEPDIWQKACGDFLDSKEGGQRCLACYKLRLNKTHVATQARGFDFFATTLTISPHKNSAVIIGMAKEISRQFLAMDFKKKDGFKKSIELAKKYNFYRQNYCGCMYSIRSQITPTAGRVE